MRKTLFILEYFETYFYFHGHRKWADIWQRGANQSGATEVWGAVAPNSPPWICHLFAKRWIWSHFSSDSFNNN